MALYLYLSQVDPALEGKVKAYLAEIHAKVDPNPNPNANPNPNPNPDMHSKVDPNPNPNHNPNRNPNPNPDMHSKVDPYARNQTYRWAQDAARRHFHAKVIIYQITFIAVYIIAGSSTQ